MSFAYSVIAQATIVYGPEQQVLTALAEAADDDGKCFPGQKLLIIKTKLSLSAIRKAIHGLERKGHLTRTQRFDATNIYRLTPKYNRKSLSVLTEQMEFKKKANMVDEVLEIIEANRKALAVERKNGPAGEVHNVPTPLSDMEEGGTQCTPPVHPIYTPTTPNIDTNHHLTISDPSLNQNEDTSLLEAVKQKYSSKKKKQEAEKPEDVSQEVWDDYLSVRKSKRAGAFTKTALRMIIEDAAKVSISLEDALKQCIKKAWVGFEAEWYLNAKKGLSNSAKSRLSTGLPTSVFKANNSEDGML